MRIVFRPFLTLQKNEILLESTVYEFCAKFHAPRWNTSDAIEAFIKPYMQLFHFWAIFGHNWPFWLI